MVLTENCAGGGEEMEGQPVCEEVPVEEYLASKQRTKIRHDNTDGTGGIGTAHNLIASNLFDEVEM